MSWVAGLLAKTKTEGACLLEILRSKSSPEKIQEVSLVFNLEIKIFNVPTWPSSCSNALFSKALLNGLNNDSSSGKAPRQVKISSYFLLRKANKWEKVENSPSLCLDIK